MTETHVRGEHHQRTGQEYQMSQRRVRQRILKCTNKAVHFRLRGIFAKVREVLQKYRSKHR
jgi:hypothetical protein